MCQYPILAYNKLHPKLVSLDRDSSKQHPSPDASSTLLVVLRDLTVVDVEDLNKHHHTSNQPIYPNSNSILYFLIWAIQLGRRPQVGLYPRSARRTSLKEERVDEEDHP